MGDEAARRGRRTRTAAVALGGLVLLGACSGSGGADLATGERASAERLAGTTAEGSPDDTAGGDLGGVIRGIEVTTSTTEAPAATTTTAPPPPPTPSTTVAPLPAPTTAAPTIPVPAAPTSAPAPAPTVHQPSNPAPVVASSLSADERRVLDAINAGRAAAGRPALVPAADLMTAPRNEVGGWAAAGVPSAPNPYSGLARSWTQLLALGVNGPNLDNVVGRASTGEIQGQIPANATHIGIGVATGGAGAFTSLRFAVQ